MMKPIFHDVEQNSDDWESLRVGKVTSSNAPLFMANYGKAFGDPAKKYALQIALERITGAKAEYNYSNKHMERGHEQEPIARMLYEDTTFSYVLNGGFFDCGDYGDSPDGIVENSKGIIEIKSVIASVHYATLTRNSFDPSYKWQLISHLDCTQMDWVDFVSYCADFPEGKQLIIHRLNKDDFQDEISQLQERRNQFLELIKTTQEIILNG
ncbi:YqaJ viral recombinase family protein [Providencia rettgeri]|uniref:YqaJ viral recombinase family protein n=1 Tax=Providencia TaxID=586 RepID=UPI0015F2AD79|nr:MULTISPECIES: YqaJ viral recombinase family protein [Providencia]MBQ0364982.1 YqaJ viral recombinase family protein [Providencia rettgeri]WIE07385.1 YqaJ viral recombinase family protein [Providencia rettgeri]